MTRLWRSLQSTSLLCLCMPFLSVCSDLKVDIWKLWMCLLVHEHLSSCCSIRKINFLHSFKRRSFLTTAFLVHSLDFQHLFSLQASIAMSKASLSDKSLSQKVYFNWESWIMHISSHSDTLLQNKSLAL